MALSPTKSVQHEGISDESFDLMISECIKAKSTSYSPYSKFRVGCAILIEPESDEANEPIIITGANVENASYGAAICAERTAITKAVSMGKGYHKRFQALAVSTDLDSCASPCGICRQVIREFAGLSKPGLEMPVFMFNNDASKCIKMTINQLLPLSFGPDDLGIDPN